MESDIEKLNKIFYCDYHKRMEELKRVQINWYIIHRHLRD